MSLLLIGGDSYLGRSISLHFEKMGFGVTTFSSRMKYSKHSYEEFDGNFLKFQDFAVLIGTPGHYRTQNGLSDIANIMQILAKSKLNVYAISTIHTLMNPLRKEDEYIRLNREFEKLALLHNFKVIRIPNFIGLVPAISENQARLLPWSLLDNFKSHGFLKINSSLESEFEWITAEDLCEGILILENNNSPGVVEFQPGYILTLGDLVNTFSDFAAANQNLSVRVQVLDRKSQRKVILGDFSMSVFGWKSKLTGSIMQGYFGDYLHQNWSNHA